MKKAITLLIILCFILVGQAQVTKTANVTTAGTLSSVASSYLSTVTNLTITGTIDARDFKTMRDNMPLLAVLDISGVNIAAYYGDYGTINGTGMTYPANNLPVFSFCNYSSYNQTYNGKSTLISIVLPTFCTRVESNSFTGCTGLKSVVISNGVSSIGEDAFGSCTSLKEFIVQPDNQNFSSLDGVLFDKNKTVLIQCPTAKIGTYTIPNTVNSINSLAFFGCSSLIGNLVIPNAVIKIGKNAFNGCKGFDNALIIPNSVTLLDDYAFNGCSGLTSLSIPNAVITIGNNAFENCSGLNSLSLGNGVTSIGNNAFGNCSGLNIVTIGNKVTSIGQNAFNGCSALTNITIPNSVISIGSGVFWNCTVLKSVALGSGLNSIENGAFDYCRALSEFVVDPANIKYSSIDGVLFNINKTSLIRFPEGKLGSYSILSTVTSIGSSAFKACKGITNISFPNTVTIIGDNAFQYCSGLTSLTIGNKISSIGISAFSGCFGLTSLIIPNSVTSIGRSAFADCEGLTKVDIPNSIISIEYGTFSRCTGIISLTIPDNVIKIGGSAFEGCSGLTDLTIGSGVKVIENSAFFDCLKLTKLLIPNNIVEIGSNSFYRCTGLTSLTIGSSVVAIGKDAFMNCIGLKSITILATVPAVLSSSFTNMNSCYLYVPIGSLDAYKAANIWKDFYNILDMKALILTLKINSSGSLFALLTENELNMSTSLTVSGAIDARDFKTIRDLMPNLSILDLSAVTIATYTGSRGTGGSNNIIYPDNSIPQNAFFDSEIRLGKSSLTSIILPSSLKSIGDNAFFSCIGLKTLSIPSSVTSIGSYALAGCSFLTSIIAYGKIPVYLRASNFVFDGINTNTCALIVPTGSLSVYQSAYQWQDFKNIVEVKDFSLSSNSINFLSNGGVSTIDITSNTTWSAVSDQSWLTVSSSGSNNGKLTLTAINNTGVTRTALITVTPIGWSQQTINVTQVAGGTGFSNQTIEAINFYPNPMTDRFQINGLVGQATLSLIDLEGRLLLTKKITGDEFININSIPKGVYIVKIVTHEGTKEGKLLKN